jgi:hypothetical protein
MGEKAKSDWERKGIGVIPKATREDGRDHRPHLLENKAARASKESTVSVLLVLDRISRTKEMSACPTEISEHT